MRKCTYLEVNLLLHVHIVQPHPDCDLLLYNQKVYVRPLHIQFFDTTRKAGLDVLAITVHLGNLLIAAVLGHKACITATEAT